MNKEIEISYNTVREKIKTYITDDKELQVIDKAYKYAKKHHEGQKRKTGVNYICHPLNVAYILTDLNVDYITLASALLHETINHGGATYLDIELDFGVEIASIVKSISKINKLTLNDNKESTKNNLKKVLVGLSNDVRVLYIKLADRLHNMRTLWALTPEEQKEKANETESILIPIAHRLGINTIKSELEDLALQYTRPDIYHDIEEKLNEKDQELQHELDKMKKSLEELMQEHNISYYIKARVKSVHSIYKKMAKGKKWNEIYDILALRIIVDKVSDCYLVLGLIHEKYEFMPKRFKDYIAKPKANMYESLHTGIYGKDGYIYEVQIRTHEMDDIAEKGIASHWSYKEHTNGAIKNNFEQKLELFRSLIESHSEEDDEELKQNLKSEVLSPMIYCYTPKGDVVELPQDSTPIDFAYRIHSKVGDTTVGAIVNNAIVPLDSALHDGDIISIKTSKEAKPSKQWLDFVKTSQAKNKIKSYFSKQDKELYIKRGEEALDKEIRRRKLSITETLNQDNLNKICTDLKLDNLEDLYLSVGSSRYTPSYIINLIYEDKKEVEDILLERTGNRKHESIDYKSNIIVAGCGDIKVSIANCCKPIKGDEIVGYITKGEGISVHKKNCPNISNTDRLIDVSWNNDIDNSYYTDIKVTTSNEKNHLIDIISLASTKDISIENIISTEDLTNTYYQLTLKIKNTNLLEVFMHALEMQKYVKNVERYNNN